MTLPKLPRLSAPEIVNGRSLYTVADLRAYAQEYGQSCFEAGVESATPALLRSGNPIPQARPDMDAPVGFGKYSSAVNDLMGMMGMKK